MGGRQKNSTAIEQAVISKNKEYMCKLLEFEEEVQEKMVREIGDELFLSFLEILTELYQEKKMRYEAVVAIQNSLVWRKESMKAIFTKVQAEDGSSPFEENVERLKKIQDALKRGKIDLNKMYELRGKILFAKQCVEERTEEKENVPLCIEK